MSSLPQQLARAVVRGMLPPGHALAAIATTAANEAAREGRDVGDAIRLQEHLLWLLVDKLEIERCYARGAIENVTMPMLRRREPPPRNAIRAAAHDANADHGFPLTEDDVEEELLELLRRVRAKAIAESRGVAQPWRPRRYHA